MATALPWIHRSPGRAFTDANGSPRADSSCRRFGIGVIMRKRLFFVPALAVFAVVLALPSAAAAPWRTLVTTSGSIEPWQWSLDASGRAAWVQYPNDVSGNSCFQIRQGALMRGQNLAVTPCIGTLSGHVAVMTAMAEANSGSCGRMARSAATVTPGGLCGPPPLAARSHGWPRWALAVAEGSTTPACLQEAPS